MKEGTVSSGVALRPRPTEVQPHFLGSNNYFGIFIYCMCHIYLPTSVTALLSCIRHIFLPISVTPFL